MRSVPWSHCAILCLAGALGTATPLLAQSRSVAEELRLNVHAGAVRQGSDTGIAPGLSVGYGSSRWFVPFITLHRARIGAADGEFRLRHLDAGVRVHVRGPHARLVPFALGGVSWRSAAYDDRLFLGDSIAVKITGQGPVLGAGMLYYLQPRLALETSGKWSGGSMDQATTSSGHFAAGEHALHDAALRLNIGLSWFPVRQRR